MRRFSLQILNQEEDYVDIPYQLLCHTYKKV